MADVYVFVSNRGGVGKSTLVSQLAPAVAAGNALRDVLVLDLSIQGDTSTMLLGGFQQPTNFNPGIRTLGAEKIAQIPVEHRALGLLNSVYTTPATSTWRGFLKPRDSPFDFKLHSVNVNSAHPAGDAPRNLWLSAGGGELFNAFPTVAALPLAQKLRAAFSKLKDTIVIIDTDAEISERVTSLVGIAAAQNVVLVSSSNWADYSRLLDDRANSIFDLMANINRNDTDFSAKITKIVFNNVNKRTNDNSAICGSEVLNFTAPKDDTSSIEEIVNHFYMMTTSDTTMFSRYFKEFSASDPTSFASQYVAGLSAIPTTVLQKSCMTGMPIISTRSPTAPELAVQKQLVGMGLFF